MTETRSSATATVRSALRRPRVRRRMAAAAAALTGAALLGMPSPAHAAPTVYRITTLGSLAVDVSGGSHGDGAAVIQWGVNGGANQEWTLQGYSDGSVSFVNYNSNKCLQVQGGSTGDGAPLVQWYCNGGAPQRFFLDQVDVAGAYHLRNVNSGKVAEVPGWSAAWGTQLDQWTSNGGGNQNFYFTRVA
jgi:hypothetical protein